MMRPAGQLLRFFTLLPPSHVATRIGLAAAAMGGTMLAALGLAPADYLVTPLVLLQALATSSGFAGPARRGHYDLLFTLGHSRVAVALAHWAMSAAPGAAAWLWVISTELIADPKAPVLVQESTWLPLLLASTIPWACTVRLPRLSGGIAFVVLWPFLEQFPRLAADIESPAWWRADHADVAVLIVGAAIGAMALAVRAIARMDLPLEAVQ